MSAVTEPRDITQIDATQKSRALRGLAHEYTDHEDPWLALHAHLAADLMAARLAWPQATDELWSEFTAAAAAHLAQTEFPSVPAEALALARGVLAAYLPAEVVQAWIASLDPAAELAGALTPVGARMLAQARLSGLTLQEYRIKKATESVAIASRVTLAMIEEEMWTAVETMYDADMAAFEAWLAERAELADDDELVSIELRWMLTVGALSALKQMPEDFYKAVGVVRSRLAWTAGPALAADLASRMPALPRRAR